MDDSNRQPRNAGFVGQRGGSSGGYNGGGYEANHGGNAGYASRGDRQPLPHRIDTHLSVSPTVSMPTPLDEDGVPLMSIHTVINDQYVAEVIRAGERIRIWNTVLSFPKLERSHEDL